MLLAFSTQLIVCVGIVSCYACARRLADTQTTALRLDNYSYESLEAV